MDEQNFTSLSTLDKLQHKSWKARISAYEDLTRLFQNTTEDSEFLSFEPHLKNMVIDSNVVAQEAALTAVLEYIRHSTVRVGSNTLETIIPSLVEKCFGAAKVGTKQKATDIVLLYTELGQMDKVIEFLLPGTSAKQPKVIVQTVITLKEIVRQFGTNHMDPKPLLRLLPKLFGHVDKNVRSETFNLTIELYQWLGDAIKNSLDGLKPIQQKELEDAFQKSTRKTVPERLIRAHQKTGVTQEITVDEDIEMVQELDSYDLADSVDITTKLPKNFYDLIASKKWQERRDALDTLLKQAKTPRILNNDYQDLISALSLRINDSNVLLVGTAANCIDAIAQGLRTDFAKYQSTIVPIMIEKLKERKPAILLHLVNGLNSVFSSLSINEWLKELAQGSKHANPQVRSECLKLVSRQLREIRVIPGKPEIKTMGNMFKRALDDADANVREAAAEGLGTMLRLLDEKAMRVFTESLEDIKMTKIKEYFNKATVRISDIPTFSKKDPIKKPIIRKSVQSTPKLVQGAPKPIQSTPKPIQSTPKSIQSTPKSIQSTPKRKLPVNATEGTPSKRPALSHTSPSSKRPEIKYVFTQEEAESRATQTIPETIYKGLQDPVWKLRLEAIDALCNHVSQNEPSIEPEIVIRLLFQKKKETNFQVMAKMFYCIQLLASHPKFTTACAALLVPSLVEKLSDVKLKKPASDCLVVLVERTSFDFLLSQTYPLLRSVKSPKVLSDALLWIHGRLMDFGVEGVQINDLVDSVKFALGNTNVTVRTNAVTVMGALRQFIGPNAISYVKDVSPALLATIEKEFDKVSKLTKPQPIKKVDMMDIDTEFSDPISTQVLPQVSAVTEVSSRVDISKQLNRAVAQCGDNNWKIRKEGLDIVQGLLSANPRLKPTLSIDFLDVLKERLNDSNKLLQIQAIEITGQLVSTMGKLFERYVRMFVDPVVNVLSDNKTHVRTAGISTLEEFRQACGMEPLIPSFGNALSNESPVLRKELLCWLNKKKLEGYDDQWISLISPLFSCIQDRNVDVRKEAQFLLPTLISLVGYEPLHRQASELKTAEKQILLPLLESFRPPESPSRTKQLKMTPSPSAVSKSPAFTNRIPASEELHKTTTATTTTTMMTTTISSNSKLSLENTMSTLMKDINSGDSHKCIDALKRFDSVVTQNPQAVLLFGLDNFVDSIAVQINLLNSFTETDNSSRLWKYLSRALILTFSNQELARSVSKTVLQKLLQELTRRMLDERTGPQETFKVLNLTTTKILENGQMNFVLSILLSKLSICTSDLRITDSLTGNKVKYTELIMKCLWKLAKKIPKALSGGHLNPDELLYEINLFFINTPPAEWKRRQSIKMPCDDLPLRTIKVLLSEIVFSMRESIFNHLTMIPDARRSSIYPYITHMLDYGRRT